MEQEPQNQQQGFDRLAIAVESLVRQERWSRRFTNLLKLAVTAYVIFFIIYAADKVINSEELKDAASGKKHAAIVKVDGPIMPGTDISAEKINPLLRKAFKSDESKAVIIVANSPGGSPVQSALINDEIDRLKKKYDKPAYVVVEDVCASGCYYIAVAADKIYANESSMVGSIGVKLNTYGLTDLMEKIGVENRSMHAGKHKNFIDPFSDIDQEGREFFKEHVLERSHQQFIKTVREGRGDRIKETEDTYTGLVWLGDEAVENGMIDGLGDLGHVAREIVGTEHVRYYQTEKTILQELMGDIGTQTASKFATYLSTMN